MELFRALAVLVEPPAVEMEAVAAALGLGPRPEPSEHTELFVFQLYPYASVYLGAEGMLGGEARDRIAGFWRALGQTPPAEPDHLAVMLALYARLTELEESEAEAVRRANWRRARKAFLWEHLLSWLPAYLSKLLLLAGPFYRRWGEILREALLEEAKALGETERLPLHLREARPLADPRPHETGEFLQSLLAPARSGMILTRADFGRAAHSLGLGTRLGERAFILRTLLGQNPAAMLDWLAAEAGVWSARHRSQHSALGIVARAWEEKAETSAALLHELSADARSGEHAFVNTDDQ